MIYKYWDSHRDGVDSCFPLFISAVRSIFMWPPKMDDKGFKWVLDFVDHFDTDQFKILLTTKPYGWNAKYNDDFVKIMERACLDKPDTPFLDVFFDFWCNVRFVSAGTLAF